MRAILLAAGRGRRLGVDEPKCLINIAGHTLLARHVDNLVEAGVDALTVVMGHQHEQLSRALDAIIEHGTPLAIERRFNELYPHGSIVSLQCAADQLALGAMWMDADVIYPAALLKKLVDSPHDNAVLIDGRSSEQGEEMMLGVKDERVRRIARSVGTNWDLIGESIGFFKVNAEGGAIMRGILDSEIEQGRLDQEHEDALNRAFDQVHFGYERADDYPWTEIDFPEDVAKAERLVGKID